MSMARRGAYYYAAGGAGEMSIATSNSLYGPRAHSPMLTSAPSVYSSGGSYGNTRPLSAPRSSARPGTPGPPGIGLNTELKLEARPVTHQGMMSLRTPFHGPGRQILDKSYFIGKLRVKKQELQNEITTMTMEIERLQKRGPATMQLDQQHYALLEEVKLLKGELSDYNMVMENFAAGADLEQLKDNLRSLKAKNENEKNKIAHLFTQRSQHERATKLAEETCLSTMAELERKLGREGPEKQTKFREAMEENKTLTAEVERLENKLEELNLSIEPLEQDLEKTSPANQKKLMLMEQLFKAQEQLQHMQNNCASLVHLSSKEPKENMLSKVRDDSAEIACAKAKSRELEVEIKEHEEKLIAAEKVLSDLKGGRAEKFLEMQQKEKKMQSFLDNYEATLHEQITAKTFVEENIEHLHKQISQVECSNSSIVSKEDIYNKNYENVEKLTKDLESQREELEQLEQMEATTMKEVEMSKQNIDALKSGIKKLANLDEVRVGSDSKYLKLEVQLKEIGEERSKMQRQLKEQSTLIETLQQQLNDNLLYKNIETLNQKLLALQQNVTMAQEELEMKERKLNYKPVLENIRLMVGQLNEEIKSKLKS